MNSGANKRSRALPAGMIAALLVILGFVLMARARPGLEVSLKPAVTAAANADKNKQPARPGGEPGKSGAPSALDSARRGAGVVTDSSKAHVKIGLSYHGDKIEFFGTTGDTGADSVVVILRSPAQTVSLNQKGRVGPFWMVVKQYQVENIPFIYKVHASRPLAEIMSPETAEGLDIGFDTIRENMKVHITKGKLEPGDEDLLFNGLVKLKKKADLYKIDDHNRISIKDKKLFKHSFIFPAAVKEGEYLVDSFLFRDGVLVGGSNDVIQVKKIGLEARLVHWAGRYPKTYGTCAVLLALGAGLLVGNVFKGGAH